LVLVAIVSGFLGSGQRWEITRNSCRPEPHSVCRPATHHSHCHNHCSASEPQWIGLHDVQLGDLQAHRSRALPTMSHAWYQNARIDPAHLLNLLPRLPRTHHRNLPYTAHPSASTETHTSTPSLHRAPQTSPSLVPKSLKISECRDSKCSHRSRASARLPRSHCHAATATHPSPQVAISRSSRASPSASRSAACRTATGARRESSRDRLARSIDGLFYIYI
jgi:hypothetical protein